MEKSYSRKEPNESALFWRLKEFYGEEEYLRRFYSRLHRELLSSYKRKIDVDKMINFLSKKKVTIHNQEVFFDLKVKRFNSPVHLGDYVDKELKRLETLKDLGASDIDATNLLIGLVLKNNNPKKADLIEQNIKPYVLKLLNCRRDNKNPYVIRIYDNKSISENISLCKDKFSLAGYLRVLEVFVDLLNRYKEFGYVLPRLELMIPLKRDKKVNIIQVLKRGLVVPSENTDDLVNKLRKNGVLTDDLEVLGEFMHKYQESREYLSIPPRIEEVLKNMEYVKNNTEYSAFFGDNFAKEMVFYGYKDFSERILKKFENIKKVFIVEEDISKAFTPVIVEVSYDCSGVKKFRDIEEEVSMLAHLCALRRKITFTCSEIATDGVLKINLTNVGTLNKGFIDSVRRKEKSLRSITNDNICICLQVTEERATQPFGLEPPKYLKVLSDMHVDVNDSKGYEFDMGDDFIVNCGDTSGNATTTLLWNRANINRGVYVYGNHLGYDSAFPREDLDIAENYKKYGAPISAYNTIQNQINVLERGNQGMNGMSGPYFLDSKGIEVYGIGFIGSTLSTDFTLFGEDMVENCEHVASKSMNDFKRRYYKPKGESKLIRYNTELHVKCFKRSIRWINIWSNKFRDMGIPVVVVTHHAPTPYSLSEEYKDSLLSAAFVNDLREFIDKHPEIRLWCHGHCHTKFDYIYNGCRCVCEPFGYFNETRTINIRKFGKRIKIEDIKSGEKWEDILKDDIEKGKVKVY